jgi:translocation and assembly module TamB
MTWQRILGWTAVSLAVLLVVVGAAGYFSLRSTAFHNYLVTKIEQQANEATGAHIRIQNLVLHLSGLSAEAYGITIHGSETEAMPPLLLADKLTVRLKIVSLLHKQVDLSEIVLLHPVVHLLVHKDGTTNLPTPPQANGNSSTSVFDLGIEHVLLQQGEIYYNDVKTPLNAELHQLQLEIKSAFLHKRYEGRLSYQDGRLQYGDMKPIPHDLNASFNATPSEFRLEPLVLRVAGSTAELEGKVRNYSNPSVDGSYKVTIRPQEFRSVLKDAVLPSGEMVLAGSLQYHYKADVSLLRSLVMDGQLNSRELAINSPDLRTLIRNVRGRFRLANGTMEARGLGADVLDGHLTAEATIAHMDTNPVSRLHAAIQTISLNAAKAALKTANLNQVPITGSISGTTDASWTGSLQSVQARSDFGLKAAITSAAAGSALIPLDGVFHVVYDGRKNVATFTNTFARTPQTRIDINGTAGQRFNLTVLARSADLRELDSLAAAFQTGRRQNTAGIQTAGSINLAGAADARMLIQGGMNDPRLRGQLNGHNLQVENTQWRSLQLGLQASKSMVSIENGSLVNARQGYVNFALSAGLSNWRYRPSSPINLSLNSRGLALAPLLQVAKLDYPFSGNLSADVGVHGTQLNPAGKGSVHLTQAKAYGQPLKEFSIQFDGDGNEVRSQMNVTTQAGGARASLVFNPKSKAYEIHLDAPGVKLEQLQPVQERNLGMTGVLSVTANGRGTVDNPQLSATVQIPQLQVRQATVSGIKSDLSVANRKAELTLDSEVAKTFVKARGSVDLNGDYYARGTLDTQGMPLEGLLALYTPVKSNGPRGILEVHASAEGPLKDKNRVQAQVVIPTFKANYEGLQIGNTRPIRARFANSIVALDPTEIVGTDTTLRVQGQVPLKGNAPATLTAIGTVDMQLLRFLQPDIQSSGKLKLDVRATGATAHPEVKGQLRIEQVSLAVPDAPVGLQNVNGVLDIGSDKINVTTLTAESGGGQISARGMINYRPQVQTDLTLQARNVRIRYQDAIRTLLDGDLSLVGTTDAANLTGRVLINSLSFTPNFDLETLAGQVQSGPESTPSEGFAQNLKLNLSVQTSRDLNLESNAVSLQGQANLRVIGTAADPVIVGRTAFTGGDIFLMNKRYKIERGTIEFSNPNRTEPVLNVLLTATINQYNLSLTFTGPLDKMQTSYISDPQLPTADIINLIARGQTPQQAASSPSNLGASSLLAQGAASQVSSGVQKLAGLSSLSIDPTLGGNDSNPGARVAMQKRVTSNFLFTFATDVSSAQREIIQGEYQFNKRWSTSVTRDENGGFAVDGKYHKRY